MRIPLPDVTYAQDVKVHPYPFQIAFQTMELLQGTIFHSIIADISAGEYLKVPENMTVLKKTCRDRGMDVEVWEDGWKYLEKYKAIFERTIIQNAIISINSSWDWYVRSISKFILFGRNYIQSPSMKRKIENEFGRICNCPINRQVSLLEEATGLVFNIENLELSNLIEMALVRHLCLHNRSEIDEIYLQKTSLRSGDEGELRMVGVEELLSWQRSFISAIKKTWCPIAMKYVNVPKFI